MRFVFILWIFFISYSSAIYKLNGVPEEVILGDTININLTCTVDSGTYVEWLVTQSEKRVSLATIDGKYNNKSCIIINNRNSSYIYDCNQSSNQYNLIIPSSLIMDGIQNDKWECNPFLGAGSNKFNVTLLVPVTIVTFKPYGDQNVLTFGKEGTQNFTCTTNAGRPAARIQWYFGGHNVTDNTQQQSHKQDGDKIISSSEYVYTVKKEDHNKTIFCEAVNIERWTKATSSVKYIYIQVPVTSVTINPTGENNIISVVEGKNHTLICNTEFSRPAAWIQWYIGTENMTDKAKPQTPEYNGDEVKSSSKLIYTGNNNSHNKTIYCESSNIEGGKKVKSIPQTIHILVPVTQLTIKPAEDNNVTKVTNGDIKVFTCTTDKIRPAALIHWYIGTKNVTSGAQLQATQDGDKFVSISVLNYTGIEENHNKTIFCEAVNIIGQAKVRSKKRSIYIQLPVIGVTILPDGENNIVNVVKGEKQNFTCTTGLSRPAAWIQWYIDGLKVTNGVHPIIPEQKDDKFISSSKLVYTGEEDNHMKKIHCEAINIVGLDAKKSSDKHIFIQVPVTTVILKPDGVDNVLYAVEGKTKTLTCITDPSRPSALIQWYIDGRNVTNQAITQTTEYSESKFNSSSVIVYNGTETDHTKAVYCEAVNIEGRNKIKSIEKHIYIQYGPKDIFLIPDTIEYMVTETGGIKMIECLATCRPNCTYYWSGANSFLSFEPYFYISSIYRNQSGEYSCSASNGFGNRSSNVIKITVRYAPTIIELTALTGNVIAEQQSATFQCNIDSYPLSDVSWLFSRKKTELQNNDNVLQSNYTINNANCFHTGSYQCNASNEIGNYLQGVKLFVKCSTRLDIRTANSPPKLGLNDAEPLNVTVYLIAYPRPTIKWIFTDKNGQNTTINSTDYFSVFEHRTHIRILEVAEEDFGVYTVYASNNIGKEYVYPINVVPQRKPHSPSNVSVECGEISITVFWKSEFDGGDKQRFVVTWFDMDRNMSQYSDYIMDAGEEMYHMIESKNLRPATLYNIFVNATNNHGTVISDDHVNCSTKNVPVKEEKSATTVVIGGITGSVLGLSAVAAVVIYLKRRKNTKEDEEPIRRSENKSSKEDNDGLKDNPLYETSDLNSGVEHGPVYSTVDKTKKAECVGTQGSVYSEVKKKGKKGKHNRDIALGNVYSNNERLIHDNDEEGVYANAESHSGNKKHIGKMYLPKKNKDGLIYADLDLGPSPSGKRFVIRGIENRTNYAMIDLNVKVDPLPSDDEDDDDAEKKTDTHYKDAIE